MDWHTIDRVTGLQTPNTSVPVTISRDVDNQPCMKPRGAAQKPEDHSLYDKGALYSSYCSVATIVTPGTY